MKHGLRKSGDEPRREYDLDKLRVADVGSGWKKGVWRRSQSVIHMNYNGAPACSTNGTNPALTTDEQEITCKKCLQLASEKG